MEFCTIEITYKRGFGCVTKDVWGEWGRQCPIRGTLHKKRSFPLRISSVNVTKSGGSCGFGHIFCAVDVSVVITEDDE